ncbi:ATP-dependent Clp protease proteolytic subunit [Marinicauda salina]|uniref:ATP-dependent Clp protease proteolytic subunit n=1 Tax=Marinicauda salina TaxID=2135793 RepID=A0A2U2BU08_9PROT|nr:ATP-dependent Clp protease proteolytic subunit [Marinicauda salina]PWE17503.1 ATP-dependent Clp protease proteolytic subunit [Marinicauda salina]
MAHGFDNRWTRNDDDDEKEGADAAKAAPDFVGKALFESRSILITGSIDDKTARSVCAQLLAMAGKSDDPILMVVSSPGGHVESGDMIHDMMKFIKPRVITLGSGWVASAGALIYVGAESGDRYCLPNTRFLLHQPSGGAGGAASDIEIQVREMQIMRQRLNQIFADATGQPIDKIAEDTDRDFWLSAKEAIDYGLCNKVVTSRDEIKW